MAYGEAEYDGRPRRRWGRRIVVSLLVLLIIVAALLVVADRVAANVAERRIAEEVQRELASREVTSSEPEVSVGGYPFLTQVLDENYESISIVLRDVTTAPEQSSVRLPLLDVVARDVNAPLDTLRSGQGDIVARVVDGVATIGYASVARLIDQPNLQLAERDGKLLASLPVELFGQRFTLVGEAQIEAVDGKIRLRFEQLEAEGLPTAPGVEEAVSGYARQLSIDVPLPPLPFALELREVTPLPEGLEVAATARDVPLNRATA